MHHVSTILTPGGAGGATTGVTNTMFTYFCMLTFANQLKIKSMAAADGNVINFFFFGI